MAGLLQGMRLLGRGLSFVGERIVALDTAAGGDLRNSIDGLRQSTTALLDSALAPMVPIVADVVAGLSQMLAAVTGLDAAQRQTLAGQEKARDAINRQADEVERLRSEVEFLRASDLGAAFGAADPRIAETTARLKQAQLVLRTLKGELGAEAGIGPRPAAAKGAAPAAKGAAPTLAAGPGEAIPADSDAGISARKELADAIRATTAVDLEGEAAILAAGEERQRQIEELLAAVVSSSDLSSAVQVEAVRDAAAARVDIEAQTQARIRELRDEEQGETMDRLREMQAARQREAQSWIQATAAGAGAVGDLVSTVGQIVVDSTEEGSEARKKAMKRAWAWEQVMAIATAAINIPLSLSQAAAGPWPAAIGFMVAAGIASTAALAGVIAKAAAGPKFHAGGMPAPDEMSITALEGEGVLSRDAMRRIGGADGLRRMNRGEAAEDGPQITVFRVGHRTTDAMIHESLRRRRGNLYDAVRGMQPRIGLHTPW
jgi:hypothetical protein